MHFYYVPVYDFTFVCFFPLSLYRLIEKKYQDQMRELVDELQQERDTIHSQAGKLKQSQHEIASHQEEEAKMKTRFNLLQQASIFYYIYAKHSE